MTHLSITKSEIICKQCPLIADERFEDIEKFRQHFINCHTETLYRCIICLKVFSSSTSYEVVFLLYIFKY